MLDRTVLSGSEAKDLEHAKKIGMLKMRHLKISLGRGKLLHIF